MTGVINTGSFSKLLWPGVKEIFGMAYKAHDPEYIKLFDQETSDMSYEEDVLAPGFGLVPVKPQGAAVRYDSHQQGIVPRYNHVAYGLGFIVTREERDDNLYPKVTKARASALARSFRITKEIIAANVYNSGFDTSYTMPGGDGKPLLATDHPTIVGNQSNELAVSADFSESSFEDIVIQMGKAVDERGKQIALKPTKIVVPVDLMFEVERVFKSALRPATANNDINAIKSMNMAPEVCVNHYLTDPDAWFVRSDVPAGTGLKCYQRVKFEFAPDNDFDTDNAKFKGYERYSFGWSDWRAIYGSPGA